METLKVFVDECSIACRLQQLAEEIHSPDLTSEKAKEIQEELKVLAATAHIPKQYIQMPVVNPKNKNEPIPSCNGE
ncbi:MAG: hypothetical protein OXO49_07140 [Gammaproteobacteria bacterium]|nr:hypothetical protein [Gammaproteobacteria bacterium]MDE0251707.1 hypothetical protein [Gammaproteobacteria bacterium]MDE0403283.1 hypothetical protein [Gammaproteobacteria bacterium]